MCERELNIVTFSTGIEVNNDISSDIPADTEVHCSCGGGSEWEAQWSDTIHSTYFADFH